MINTSKSYINNIQGKPHRGHRLLIGTEQSLVTHQGAESIHPVQRNWTVSSSVGVESYRPTCRRKVRFGAPMVHKAPFRSSAAGEGMSASSSSREKTEFLLSTHCCHRRGMQSEMPPLPFHHRSSTASSLHYRQLSDGLW